MGRKRESDKEIKIETKRKKKFGKKEGDFKIINNFGGVFNSAATKPKIYTLKIYKKLWKFIKRGIYTYIYLGQV